MLSGGNFFIGYFPIKAFLVDLETILKNEGSSKWVEQLIQQLN